MANKENKITVIIPLHDLSQQGRNMLNEAVKSVDENIQVIVSCVNGTKIDEVGKLEFHGVWKLVTTSIGDSFQELVNAAVDAVDTEWFSILEYDDKYGDIWYSNAMKYIDFKPDVNVFMFFEDIFDVKTGKYLGMGNESPWASSFSEEIGFLDHQALQNYFEYYMTGCLFKKSDWVEVGGLKEKIKVTFWYEWLLRATNNGKKVFVIPKIGYTHNMGRDDSLTNKYLEAMSSEEIEFWFDLAKRDFHFKEEKDDEYYTYKAKNEDDDGE